MQTMSHNPAFVAYAISVLALSVNLLALWGYSGFARVQSKMVINPEDANPSRSTSLAPSDPPEVARVLRAHANAMATIFPFAMLGWLFVALDGDATIARIIFAVFVAARFAHSVVYIKGLQPWRTMAFVVSILAIIALCGNVVWRLLN
jgi:microsomal prostaglandin-E synthase 1